MKKPDNSYISDNILLDTIFLRGLKMRCDMGSTNEKAVEKRIAWNKKIMAYLKPGSNIYKMFQILQERNYVLLNLKDKSND